MGKQNLAMFERAMRMFTPVRTAGRAGQGFPGDQPDAAMQRTRAENEKTLSDLQKQLEELQKQLVTIYQAQVRVSRLTVRRQSGAGRPRLRSCHDCVS